MLPLKGEFVEIYCFNAPITIYLNFKSYSIIICIYIFKLYALLSRNKCFGDSVVIGGIMIVGMPDERALYSLQAEVTIYIF